MKKSIPLHIRSKIWIEDNEGEVVFGLGRLKILDAIERLGSIHGAAKELKMSYRAIWGRIKATEDRLNRQLLVRSIGGATGGGSELTPFALSLLEGFRRLQGSIIAQSNQEFEKVMSSILNRTES
ncbi:Predicted molybdenum transport regulatory protein ModE (HTH domain/molybdenum-binding protein) [uncultured Desulfobacterium sp.]|uniref:Predicted molybdenum transport regulatory protein ModE (HTH domain/molybdenum-binding protein) n=1 Tax=uncultured Desulfobacterium sp. TaxID=201089 RepID=A0A445N213_9BACT|nr:Predicted molybdenum transport regulatory protein ModE (HTH domain/molybdenum-binding protein) [uncultured Desulfobacterium sp.]